MAAAWAIVLGCGKEQEISPGVDASFLGLGSMPVLAHSLQTLEQSAAIEGIIVVVRRERVDRMLAMIRSFGCRKVRSIVAGGAQRIANLRKAYEQMSDDANLILVHEAARPFVEEKVIAGVLKTAKRYGCAIAAAQSPDAVKQSAAGQAVAKSLNRSSVWLAQTPQAFKRVVFEKVLKSKMKLIDDESELTGKQAVRLVSASVTNIKIRTPDDLTLAAALQNVR